MLSKIKRQARSQRLHVLLMERGQTTNYQLYSVVSVKCWNVPGFQTSKFFFSTSFSSCLLVTHVLPHSAKSTQQWALLEQGEGRESSLLLTAQMAFRVMPALPSLLLRSQTSPSPCSAAAGKGIKVREKGPLHPWESTLLGLRTARGLRAGLEVTTAGAQKNDTWANEVTKPLSLFLGKGQWQLGAQAAGWYRPEAWLQPPVFTARETELPAYSYNSSVVWCKGHS